MENFSPLRAAIPTLTVTLVSTLPGGFLPPRLRRSLRLYAFESNEPARDFYEKHGFKAIAFGDGTGNEGWGDGEGSS